MLEGLHAAFHRPGTRAYRVVNGAVAALIVVSIGLLAVETMLPEGTSALDTLFAVDRVILVVFAVEIGLRILTYRPPELEVFDKPPLGRIRMHLQRRVTFALTPMMLVDLITVAALVPALRGLRALRLLRLARTGNVFKYANPLSGLHHAFDRDRLLFAFAFSLLATEVLLGGITLYLVETGTNPDIQSPGDGIWWALVTVTTVGFGDITPVTAVGRMVGGVMMIGGMFTLALFAGIVGHSLVTTVLSIREEQFRMSSYVNHIVLCGYEDGAQMLLDTLLEEVDPQTTKVVIMADRERPQDVPSEFVWVQGDPSKESELDKVRMSHASAVVIAGARSTAPQQADAQTILIAFTIRSYMEGRRSKEQRKKPLYVVTEILDSENVAHARAAGADEVVETRRVGFSLLAHALTNPGTADAMSRVAVSGENNIYVGCVPEEVRTPVRFAELAAAIKDSHDCLVLGVHDPESDADRINPPSDLMVDEGTRLIYVAERPVLPEG